MKRAGLLLFIVVIVFVSSVAVAQEKKSYKAIDEYVLKLGKLDSLTMGTISSIVTKPFKEKEDKARAIYTWIANNITYDIKSAQINNVTKNSPTEVLLYRKATGIGFANLFQDMCSSADIRCLTADGYIKNTAAEIGETDAELNHSWAVVQLGTSPDTWYYVDAAMGSGYPDITMKNFTRSFNGGYFFADKKIFNWQHFPDNEAWKLGDAPKSKRDFFALPVIKTAAYDIGLSKYSPAQGIIKVKLGNAITFSFAANDAVGITKIDLIYGSAKKQKTKEVLFNFADGNLTFSNKFEIEGEYPLLIRIDGKEMISYKIVAEE